MCCRRRVHPCPYAANCARPSSVRNQLGRPLDGFQELHTPCKRGRKARITNWEKWYGRDIKVCNELAYRLEKPVDEISELMYNFTLQNYSHILNPKGKGWNHCRVPLSRGDICERYFSIFDLEGNLRDPTHPRSLFKLLQVIKTISTSDVADIAEPPQPSPIQKLRMIGVAKEVNGSKDLNYLRNINSTEQRQIDTNSKPGVHPTPPESQASSEPTVHPHNIHKDPANTNGIPITLHDSDMLLLDRKGRRRAQGSNQLGSLRLQQKLILHKMLQKNLKDEDPNRFLDALAKTDLNESPSKQFKHKQATQDLSNFYSSVVTDKPDPGLKAGKQDRQLDVQQEPPRERRYFGETLPVLFHEPYDTNKRTTWLRRHPDQLRMQEDGKVGMSRIRRYRRESILKALQQARTRWSIHSINSPTQEPAVESLHELHKKPEYRRVFSSTSRRVKISKHNRVSHTDPSYP